MTEQKSKAPGDEPPESRSAYLLVTQSRTADDLSAIEAALHAIRVIGDRYPAHLQQRVDR